MSAKNVGAMADREIVMSRVFDAPREMVWDAWVDPKQIVQWWGPVGFTTTIREMDVRKGGAWKQTMHGPDGVNYPHEIVFTEVVKHERIAFEQDGGREGGRQVHFNSYWTFEEENGGKTKLTLRMVFDTVDDREFVANVHKAIEGGAQTLARLADKLAATPITIERTYDAPIEMVWKAITELEQMKQWYFPTIVAFKPEVGFETRVDVHHEGKDHLHLWKVKEVVPGKKISYSWSYVGVPGDSRVTFELAADGKKTKLKFSHEGVGTFKPEENPMMKRSNFVMGWTHFTKALGEFVEKKK